MNRPYRKTAVLAAAIALLSGCASTSTTVAPAPQPGYTVLGQAQGDACGSLGLFGTSTYFVPMGLNGRYERAYQAALDSVPGATGLINVTLQEDWAWWFVSTARCVKVSGVAIK